MAAVHDSGFELVYHPPYYPDMAPSDYFLFPTMKKKKLDWEAEKTADEVTSVVEDFFEDQDESFYMYHGNPSTALQYRWKKCVDCSGDYLLTQTTFGQIRPLYYS